MCDKETGLVKLIDSASFFNPEEIQVTILDNSTDHGLVKSAADSRVSDFVDDLTIEPGKMYLHINAMGCGEYFGSNKNGDYFPEENLKKWFKTFETSPAHIFRHHINKDPAKAIGKVIFAIYNERMHRVEVVADVDKMLGHDIKSKLAKGEFPLTSMACKTPYDVCSICGNKAHTLQEYCEHLKYQLNQVLPDGRKVMALNEGPLRFFDMSIVMRPADITSSVLEKVAFQQGHAVLGSAEEAMHAGLLFKEAETVKSAAMNKMADLVKTIEEGSVVDASGNLKNIMEKVQDPQDSIVGTLSKFPWNDIFNSLAEAGVNPSIRFMCELVMQKYLGDKGEGLGTLLSEFITRVHPALIPEESLSLLPEISNEKSNPILKNAISRIMNDASLSATYVEKRASMGYTSWGGHVERADQMKTPEMSNQELYDQLNSKGLIPGTGNAGMWQTLLTMGGMALISRYYISSLMDEKFKELEKNVVPVNGTKIGIVKSAESLLSDLCTSFVYNKVNADRGLLKSADSFFASDREARGQQEHGSSTTSTDKAKLHAGQQALLHAKSPKLQVAGKAITIAKRLSKSVDNNLSKIED